MKALYAVLFALAATSMSAEVAVSTINPAGGLTRGGEYVHVHGAGLFSPPLLCPAPICSLYVNFGDAGATVVDDTATDLVVIAPPHAPGPVDVEVHIAGSPSVFLPSAYIYQEPLPGDLERYLVPIAISAAGAGGTSWRADLFAYNGTAETLNVGGATTVAPFSSSAVTLPPAPGNSGAFVYVPKRLADDVSFSLRVHDTTHDADGWGVEIPVVAESRFRRGVILSTIPNDSRFRTLLRIYSYASADVDVLLTLRDDATGELLENPRTVTLRNGLSAVSSASPLAPAYAQVALDPLLPAGSAHARIRAEIVTTSSNVPPIWAFVSITNNVTQQVTTVTPAVTTTAVSIPTADTLPLGNWNAGSAGCAVVTSTDVSITAGCTLTTFPYPALGADHRFEADGHTIVTVGPSGDADPGQQSHISGVLQGDSLTIVIHTSTTTFAPITFRLGTGPQCGFPCV
jgi:hypothetical protein